MTKKSRENGEFWCWKCKMFHLPVQTKSNFKATLRALVQRLNTETGVTLAETKSTDNVNSTLGEATNELTINKPKSGKIWIIL